MRNYPIAKIFLVIISLMLSELSTAEPPLPFSAYYDARFQGLKAQAEISLTQLSDTEFISNSQIKVRLFGATVSTITENSQFEWHNDAPRPQHYEYDQSGIRGRSRKINFDWQNNLAIATVKDENVELQLAGNTLDELSMYALIKNELSNGKEEITFSVIDSNVVEDYHYRVIGEEDVATDSGTLSAIKVERIRENSDRLTQLWFAKNNDMLLIKLYQLDPDGDEIEITLSEALINGQAVRPQAN